MNELSCRTVSDVAWAQQRRSDCPTGPSRNGPSDCPNGPCRTGLGAAFDLLSALAKCDFLWSATEPNTLILANGSKHQIQCARFAGKRDLATRWRRWRPTKRALR